MAHWCDTCGQRLPDGELPADATWLGATTDGHQHSFTKPAGAKKGGSDKKLLAVVGVALAIWGLFVGIGRIVTPDDSIDEQAAAEIDQARLDRVAREAVEAADAEREAARQAELKAERQAELEAEQEAANIAAVDGAYGAADAAPGFPDADQVDSDAIVDDTNLATRPVTSVQVERLQRQLTRRSSSPVVAYRSATGVVVIDLLDGRAVTTPTSDIITPVAAGAQLLRSGAATYAIDPATLQVTQVGEASSLVLGDALDGNTYVVDTQSGSQPPTVQVMADGAASVYRTPGGGFQLQMVDGLGLLAVPQGPTGETLIARADSFENLSQNRVLTGSQGAILEQVCETQANCSLVISQLGSEDQTVVPASFVRFGDQYVLSPDGSSLVRYSREGFAEVFVSGKTSVSNGSVSNVASIAWIVGAGMRAPAWGPNSDFIVWIDRIGDPTLKVMFPDERDWITVDLRDLGAPPPSGPEVIAFLALDE